MDAVLIQPSYGRVYGFKEDISSKLPPLGLMYLSSFAKSEGFDVEVVDLETEPHGLERILGKSDFYGISSSTSAFREACDIARRIKFENRESFVVLGGAHASAVGDEVFDVSGFFDAVVVGEGERSFVELLRGNRESVPGVIFREGIFQKGDYVDVNDVPFPDYDAVDMWKYRPSLHRALGGKFAMVMTSRGCPFSCKYCGTQSVFGKQVRSRSVDNVLEEVDFLVKEKGVKNLMFWDDTLTLDRERVFELMGGLENYDLKWSCNTRADLVDGGVLDAMKDAGCKIIFYGVESSSEDILKKLGRSVGLSDVERAIALGKEKGIRSVASMMIGTPFDDAEQIQKNVKYMIDLNPDLAFFSAFAPYPGTQMYDFSLKEGLVDDWRNWVWRDFKGVPLNIPTANKDLSREEIQKALEGAYSDFYSRESFFRERAGWSEDWELNVLRSLYEKFK